jgi:predicted RNA binding protein YcfA (HicA-like mRNA interferase family)
MKVRDVIKRLEKAGWYIVRMKGSHRQYKHDDYSGLVTVSGHTGDDGLPER